MNINERLDELEKRLQSVSSLINSGTGNELKFFIFDYEPKDELLVRKRTGSIIKNRTDIFKFDLYEIMLKVIDDQGYMDALIQAEKSEDKNTLLTSIIQPLIRVQSNNSPYMNEFTSVKDDGNKIILLTGVGKSYPYIRSHTILTKLQEIFKLNPVIMLYPGSYNLEKEMTLKLFSKLDDDNYYRAFNLVRR